MLTSDLLSITKNILTRYKDNREVVSMANNSRLYYKKDKKVKLIRKTTTKDKYGNSTRVYRYLTATAIWAYARQLSQDQKFAAAQYGESESRLFVLNYRDDLKVYDFIEYRGVFYQITRLDTQDDYNGELFVYVKEAATGDKPSNVQPAETEGE